MEKYKQNKTKMENPNETVRLANAAALDEAKAEILSEEIKTETMSEAPSKEPLETPSEEPEAEHGKEDKPLENPKAGSSEGCVCIEKEKKKIPWGRLLDVLLLFGVALFAFYVNRNIEIKGLYMDDLYMWSCYGEQSLMEFAFPIGTSTRFRPVYWLATYLQMAIIGNHINWFVPFNILCNIAVAYTVFYIAKRISRCRFLAFGAAICYLASRFAYYQIGQALGLMETMALFLALLILYQLYRYLTAETEKTAAEMIAVGEAVKASEQEAEKQNADGSMLSMVFRAAAAKKEEAEETGKTKAVKAGAGNEKKQLRLSFKKSSEPHFFLALFLYFLLVFVHERYLALLPLFYLVLLCKQFRTKKAYRKAYFKENLRLWIIPAVLGAVIMLIRFFCIGTAIPAGTGGTEVTETFRLADAFKYALEQVLYIFGVNAGPEHLSGLPWEMTPAFIKALTKISVLSLFVICAMYGIVMLLDLCSKEKKDRRYFWESFQVSLLFLCFIALCIGCSSVTIRVEMRWIYVSYAAALIYGTYLIRVVGDAYRRAAEAKTAENAEPQTKAEALDQKKTMGAEPSKEETSEADAEAKVEAKAAARLSKEEAALLEKEQRGNVFARSSETVADRLLKPMVIETILALVFALYCGLSVYTNMYYRQYFPKIYFWQNQLRMNSLAEETVEKYGVDGVLGKDIYILGNTYEVSDFYKDTFFKTFDPEKKAEGTEVYFIETLEEIPKEAKATGEILVIEEVPEADGYRDITASVLP